MKTEDKITKYLITEALGLGSVSTMLDSIKHYLDIEEPKKASQSISDFGKLLQLEISDLGLTLYDKEKDEYEKKVTKLFDSKFLPFLKKLEKKPDDKGLQKKVEEYFRKLEKEIKKF